KTKSKSRITGESLRLLGFAEKFQHIIFPPALTHLERKSSKEFQIGRVKA
ncbi:hypothetical protein Bpfe_009254, partial [Biomphalaria pfeifferi]